MKLDPALIRDLLERVESLPPAHRGMGPKPGEDRDAVNYHLAALIDAGFVRGGVLRVEALRGYPASVDVEDLTWEGRQVLDAIRNPSRWGKVQSAVAATANTAAVEVVKELVKRWMGQ